MTPDEQAPVKALISENHVAPSQLDSSTLFRSSSAAYPKADSRSEAVLSRSTAMCHSCHQYQRSLMQILQHAVHWLNGLLFDARRRVLSRKSANACAWPLCGGNNGLSSSSVPVLYLPHLCMVAEAAPVLSAIKRGRLDVVRLAHATQLIGMEWLALRSMRQFRGSTSSADDRSRRLCSAFEPLVAAGGSASACLRINRIPFRAIPVQRDKARKGPKGTE